jgi:hypothetical protein
VSSSNGSIVITLPTPNCACRTRMPGRSAIPVD